MLVFSIFTSLFAEEKPETETKQEIEKKVDNKFKAKISFSGDVQYRIRADIHLNKDTSGAALSKQIDHQHRYAWNFIAKAIVSENLFIGMRLSNPSGYITDDIVDNLKTTRELLETHRRFLAVPEMYFKWNVGIFYIAGGVIPVISNTVLSLSGYEDSDFKHATGSWKDKMNNSQTGLNLGLNFINNKSSSFGLNTIYTIASGVGKTNAVDAFKNEQLRFIFSFPLYILDEKLSLLPVIHFRTNICRSADLEKANHSLVGGIDININPIKQLSFNTGFAVGGNKNECQKDDPGYDTLKTAPLGLLTAFKITLNPGFGKGIIGLKISTSKDREANPEIVYTMLRWDIKYAIPIKGLTIMPRLRLWYGFNDNNKESITKLRPALALIGKF